MQFLPALVVALFWMPGQEAPVAPAAPPPFDQWRDALVAEARGRGFSDALIAEAIATVQPLVRIVDADRHQAELTLTFERYLATRVTPQVTRRGREIEQQQRDLLADIERAYGVQRRFVLAIWGMESRYGRNTGSTPVFQALATLAWEPRRANFFRGQLFDALTMVSRGNIDVPTMTGSWAGAMGQPQFMPSSYLAYAEDFDGDGRRDIWRSTPDTLASIANYLKSFGWDSQQTWGREVTISPQVRRGIEVPVRTAGCSAMREITERRPLSEWRRLGVRRVDGGPLPEAAIDAGLVDVGRRSFLVYPNYDTLMRYNCAHHYALSVAMLAERLR